MKFQKVVDYFNTHPLFMEFIYLFGLFLVSVLFYVVLRKYILQYLYRFFKRTKNKWDQMLFEQGVFDNVARFIPTIMLYRSVAILPTIGESIQKFLELALVIIIVAVFVKALDAGLYIYNTFPISLKRPLTGVVQILKIGLYAVGGVILVSILIDQPPWFILSGLGAMTAILTIVFQSTILSFVTGIRLINNDLIRVGDWIEMPKFGADGDVIEIGLHTIRVQNWDKTITVIPTHKLMDEYFINWRGMREVGGRRVKRSILIDQTSVKFCDREMIERYKKIHLLKGYVEAKEKEIEEYNKQHNIDPSSPVHGRRMTNLGTFRAYLTNYLKQHPKIRQDMLIIVRHLQPTTEGLPVEVYFFTNDTAWVNYESIQADVFDHIFAVVPEFGLRVYQKPSGYDLKEAEAIFAAGYTE
ncbi:MAG: mechanosensitive ion channel [Firmicutes bacterium]|nr:mechanosensitive ion channel [Bacillota bacterium]